jgi:hypothetical protein
MSVNKDHNALEKVLQELLKTPEPRLAFRIGLRAKVNSRAAEMTNPLKRPKLIFRKAYLPLPVLALLIGAVLLTGPSKVLAGLRIMLGYQPEIGLVEIDENLRFLIIPPVFEQNGVTLTFTKGIADNIQTVLVFSVDGFQPDPPLADPGEINSPAPCSGNPVLVTPSQTLEITQGDKLDIRETGYTYRYMFPALPANENEVILKIPCLIHLGSGPYPTDLEIPLTFTSEGPLVLTPVGEILVPNTPEPIIPATSSSVEPAIPTEDQPPASPIDIQVSLDSVVPTDTGILLIGRLGWTDDRITEWGVLPEKLTITDARGQELQYEESYENRAHIDLRVDKTVTPWAYIAYGENIELPLTITFNAVTVTFRDEAAFSIDVGTDPQIEQVWDLQQEIQLGDYKLQLISVKMKSAFYNEVTYDFTLQSISTNPEIVSVLVLDPAKRSQAGGGGGGSEPGSGGEFTVGLNFEEPAPTGVLDLQIGLYTLFLTGSWEVSTSE